MRDDDSPDMRPRRGLRRLRDLRWSAVVVTVAFATAPLAGFVYENRYDLTDVGAVAPWWSATIAVALGLLVGLLVVTRTISADRLALVVGVVVAAFYNFGRIAGGAGDGSLARFVVVVAVLATGVLLLGRLAPARRFVGLMGVMLAVIPLLGYLGWRISAADVSVRPPTRIAAPRPGGATAGTSAQPTSSVPPASSPVELVDTGADAPDIYLFVLDERARDDQLARVFGLDRTAFDAELADLGFSVSPTSYTAYPKTLLSLSSVFEMDYVAASPADVEAGLLPYAPFVEGENAFMQGLRARGYDLVYAHPGSFDWLTCRPGDVADVCIEPRTHSLRLSEVDRVIAEMTPLQLLTSETRPYTDPVHVVQQAADARGDGGPRLVFGHVLSPHGPYRYEPDCSLRETFLESEGLERDERMAAYTTDVVCTDALTLQAVRSIVLRDPEAIVIVLSDHGSNFEQEGPTLADWSEAGLVERFAVLDAVRAPGCDLPAERGVIVNLLRRIQACLDGVEPTLLPERAWMWTDDNPGLLEEIPDAAARLGSVPR